MTSFNGMWVAPESDPRTLGNPVGEIATIREYLTNYRLTLGLKCEGLTAEQLATRSVPPSTMSLLGLIRHTARVEHNWFFRVMQGHYHEVPRIYWTVEDNDVDFNEVAGEPALVDQAFADWREQIAAADKWLDGVTDLGVMVALPGDRGGEAAVRDILIHMIEEYARHCGHADLLRECIDGRTGQ
ncbi:DinB family protein [Actinoplanes sp. TRM 88003]|uniref:DinB family protein n=1 Tax=Paractinoplanes aksuensis TaxID=2939490 RepID=A0ABT1DV49_9ACTN|nr:DinB family protein [Actinoplanes aksuensis]MCO8274724.1 DinB family protein [Actinoplanes aksuensis]